MFITRATRHDKDDIRDLLATKDWASDTDLDEGKAFIARDGAVVGCVRAIEVEPQTVVLDSVLVLEAKRGNGIGTQLMQAAMNNQGGKLYLCCHEERIPFYERVGFKLLDNGFDDAPESVRAYWRKVGDYPTEEGHEHFFMTAR